MSPSPGHGSRWGGRAGGQWRGGGRPPWWPADRAWPPTSAEDWHRGGRRVVRRLGCAALLLLLLLGVAGTALIWLTLSVTGSVGSGPLGRLLAGGGILLGVGAVIAAWAGLHRLSASAGGLVVAARRIEEGDYSTRAPVRGPSELRTLARAFNAMSGRLEAEQARRESVLADVAHELRTPITVIRAQAEGIVDGVYSLDAEHMRPVLAATRTLEVLVDDLRTLALAETGSLQLRREAVEVAVLVQDTLATFADVASAAGISLVADIQPRGLTVEADPVRLGSVLRNLVGNALRHTDRGGAVTVRAVDRVDSIEISVRDNGRGIPPDLLPRVFDRFVKGPGSDGSGLGLAIVRDIVEAHGGKVDASSAPGEGTEVRLSLPH